MPDAEPQKVATETATTTTVKTEGPPTPPIPAADDGIRKWMAGVDSIVFLILVGGICGYLIYHQGTVGADVLAILIMVIQAMINVITTERNYFYGSSSGSTAKSTLLGK